MDVKQQYNNKIFSSPVRMNRKSYGTPGVGVGVGKDGGIRVDKMLKFYIEVFDALSGELVCMRTSLSTHGRQDIIPKYSD